MPGAKVRVRRDSANVDRTLAHLHLQIELESEPIAGLVSGPYGNPHRFSGWIELTEAIERVRAPASEPCGEGSLGATGFLNDCW